MSLKEDMICLTIALILGERNKAMFIITLLLYGNILLRTSSAVLLTDENDLATLRRKRGSVVNISFRIASREGKRAAEKLLHDAQAIASPPIGFKAFRKSGGYAKALQDFQSLRPRSVIDFSDGYEAEMMVGRVGDRTIILKKRGPVGKPTVELIQQHPESMHHIMDIVTYVD